MIVKVLLVVAMVVAGACFVVWLGAYASLDRDRQHSAATAELPEFSFGAAGQEITLWRVSANGMQFRTRTAGFPGSRGNVILLHGFPETSAMWEPMLPALADAGFQVVAFDQRGYSPGARPESVTRYNIEALVSDVFAVADAVGFERFHLVGHDWGAGVGWALALTSPERLESWTSLSIPHLLAYAAAIADDPDQQDRSSYIGFFRTPFLPEILSTFNRLSLLKSAVWADHDETILREYVAVFSEPGALTAALNWYRASGLDLTQAYADLDGHLDLPVTFIWGSSDPVIGSRALDTQRGYFHGPFREVELDTGHWLMQTRPEAVTTAVLSQIMSTPNQAERAE
jgi:pimeloyl-ACP methyl ester carboxylesterase